MICELPPSAWLLASTLCTVVYVTCLLPVEAATSLYSQGINQLGKYRVNVKLRNKSSIHAYLAFWVFYYNKALMNWLNTILLKAMQDI